MQLDKAIKSRKSIRKFKDKNPDWRDIVECIDAARYAPMAGNIFSVRFILIDDKEKIIKIAEAAQQPFIKQVNYLVVVCSDYKKTTSSYEERGEKYSRQQVGAAIQNFLLKIEEGGLSTCWIGHFVDKIIKRELKIPEGIEVEAVLPIGYEYPRKYTKKAKISLDGILYFNKWKEKRMKPLKKLDV